ncbi:MAG: hypothetical protein JWL68_5341 [Actinomycetia bacterium]|nr:hypothetical protein [Actinomycetes bacterium]
MSMPPAPVADAADRRASLFTPGPRLGWVFRDRRQLAAPFPEPRPDLEAMRAAAAQQAESAEKAYRKIRKFLGIPSTLLFVVLLLANGCAANISGSGPPVVSDLIALLICGPGMTLTFLRWRKARQAAAAAGRVADEHQRAVRAWQQREEAWQQAELSRLDQVDEWGSAQLPGGTQRADVFGGSLRGWQALLTTHGTSLLASQPVLTVDLTGEVVSQELTDTARAAGVPAAVWLLPAQLGASGVLSGLSAAQFADALAEAVHSGGPAGAARAERAVDTRVLEQLHGALGGNVTPGRLAAAVRAALGHAERPAVLSPAEQALISSELFPPEHRRQIEPNLVRIEAFLTALAQHTEPPGQPPAAPEPPAYYTCLALEPAARSARAEVLAALAVQWLTVQVTSSNDPAPAVIIVGADEISRPHLERLAGACERRGVPLTLLFRHLRDTGLGMLGGGTAAFMRLGHHAEAEQAAAYIGRQHRFVISNVTATLGGSDTHTLTETEGQTTTDTIHVGGHAGWPGGSQRPGLRNAGRDESRRHSRSRSVARNWSTARSWAESTNWSNAAASKRVYEYAVEPAVLQNLPDQALLLVTRGSGGPVLTSVECDPAIVTLPRVSSAPLPDPADVRLPGRGTGPLPGPGRPELSGPGVTLGQTGPDRTALGQTAGDHGAPR